MTRRVPAARRGVTLIELLVAMAIAGIVATFVTSWIVHASRQAHAAERRDDREEALALVRSELFQDGSRGRTLALERTRWTLSRPGPGPDPDTVEWRIDPDRVSRNGRQILSQDTLVEGSVEPRFAGMSPDWDAWIQADRDGDDLVDPEILPRLERLELRLVVRRGVPHGAAPVLDTLRFSVPLLGPG